LTIRVYHLWSSDIWLVLIITLLRIVVLLYNNSQQIRHGGVWTLKSLGFTCFFAQPYFLDVNIYAFSSLTNTHIFIHRKER